MHERIKKSLVVLAMLASVMVLSPAILAQDPVATKPVVTAEDDDALKANIEVAYAQHEIILLLIKNDQFDKVRPAAQILLGLHLPKEQELNTVKSLTIISQKLYEKGRAELAYQILDAATHSISDPSNKSKVYLILARYYKLDGQDEKAIESLKKSMEFRRP